MLHPKSIRMRRDGTTDLIVSCARVLDHRKGINNETVHTEPIKRPKQFVSPQGAAAMPGSANVCMRVKHLKTAIHRLLPANTGARGGRDRTAGISSSRLQLYLPPR